MAAIPGIRFDITGASGSQGLLTPKSGWFAYAFPRGGYASQDSTGTLITFDSAAIAGRFAALNWIQVGEAATIRQVSAVGGNSLSVSGAAVTVTKNQRIFLIGSTEPTISGGSVTYSTPATTIRQRDDDGSDLYTNSTITSTANGLIQFYSLPAVYDILVQDSNRAIQGSLIDVPVGVAEGVSTSLASVFGATVTINAAFGLTGWATFGQTVTMNANAGVTGTLVVGATATFSGKAAFGNSVSIDGALGVTGSLIGTTATFSQTLGTSRNVVFRRLISSQGTALQASNITLSAGWGSTASVSVVGTDTRGRIDVTAGGAGIGANPDVLLTFVDGAFTATPFITASRADFVAPAAGYWAPLTSLSGPTAANFRFVETPVVGNVYRLVYHIIGT